MRCFFTTILVLSAILLKPGHAKLPATKELFTSNRENGNCSDPEVGPLVIVNDMSDDTVQRVHLTCPELYDTDGASVITCEYNNDTGLMDWTPDPAHFVCNHPCSVPDLPEGLVVTPADEPLIWSGQDIYFSCTEGVLPDEAPTESRCYNGTWTHPVPNCNLEHGRIRLKNGRVLVTYGDAEGSICYTPEWDIHNANVVCRQLGLSPYALSTTRIPFGSNNDLIHFDSVRCQGYEEKLIDCGLTFSPCSSRYYAGVVCLEGDESANEGAVRLIETSVDEPPRVELYLDGVWGAVCAGVCSGKETHCSETWTVEKAGVFCREMGHPKASMIAVIDDGEENPALDLTCPVDAESLESCNHRYLTADVPCNSGALHVACENPDKFSLRLTNGSSKDEGRLEIFDGGYWRIVPSFINSATPTLICEELTGNGGHIQLADGAFGSGLVMPKHTYSCPEDADSLSSCNVVLINEDLMNSGPVSLYCYQGSVQEDMVNPQLICWVSFACSATIVLVAMAIRWQYHKKRVTYHRMESFKFQNQEKDGEKSSSNEMGSSDDSDELEVGKMRTDSFKDAVFET